jgi:hypothetical protein
MRAPRCCKISAMLKGGASLLGGAGSNRVQPSGRATVAKIAKRAQKAA